MSGYKATFLVKRDTTANWNAHPSFVPKKGQIVVYTDRFKSVGEHGEEIDIPGIKVGDGKAYCIDLPFVSAEASADILEELRRHEADMVAHVTQEDRDFWNNKTNYRVEGEALFLTNH